MKMQKVDEFAAREKLCAHYCKQLAQELRGAPRLCQRMTAEMQNSLKEYLESNPTATLQDLYARFGTPHQAAESALQNPDAGQEQKQVKCYRWCRLAALAIVGLAVAYALFYCGRFAVDRLVNPPYVIISAAQEYDGPIPTSKPVE